MKNRVKQKKKKNIEEDGPDAEFFSKWRAENNMLKDMGAIDVNNKESYASEECPSDAVEVGVVRISNGGLKVTKDHFFTKAMAPNMGSLEEEADLKPLSKNK